LAYCIQQSDLFSSVVYSLSFMSRLLVQTEFGKANFKWPGAGALKLHCSTRVNFWLINLASISMHKNLL